MTPSQRGDLGPDHDPLSRLGDGGKGHPRIRRGRVRAAVMHQVILHEDPVPAGLLGVASQVGKQPGIRTSTAVGQTHSEAHRHRLRESVEQSDQWVGGSIRVLEYCVAPGQVRWEGW